MGVAALIVVFVRDRQFALAARRLRSAKQAFTSFEMVKEAMALSAHAARTSRDKAAVGRGSQRPFCDDALMGNRMAVASFVAALALALVLFRAAKRRVWKVAAVMRSSGVRTESADPRLATLVRTDMPLATCDFS